MFSPNSAVRLGCTATPRCYFSKTKQKFLISFYQCSDFFLNLFNPSYNYNYVLTIAIVRFQTGAFCICCGPRGNGTGLSRRSTSVLPYKYNSWNVPYSYFIHVLYVLYRVRIGIYINLQPPNDIYTCRTAPLTSRCCILYIYSTNICTEIF